MKEIKLMKLNDELLSKIDEKEARLILGGDDGASYDMTGNKTSDTVHTDSGTVADAS